VLRLEPARSGLPELELARLGLVLARLELAQPAHPQLQQGPLQLERRLLGRLLARLLGRLLAERRLAAEPATVVTATATMATWYL
jgi:hypothetical protein